MDLPYQIRFRTKIAVELLIAPLMTGVLLEVIQGSVLTTWGAFSESILALILIILLVVVSVRLSSKFSDKFRGVSQ